MSWMKRRGQATPNTGPVPSVPVYNPNQHSNQDWQHAATNNWYQPNPQTDRNQQLHQQQQQQQQQQHQQQQHQPPPTNYWQTPYPQNTQTAPYNQYQQNQYNQQRQQQQQQQNTQPDYYQQNVTYDQNYAASQQYGYAQTNNVYGQQQNAESDSTWNWGWGEEDNSNSNVQLAAGNNANSTTSNSVADSFANDELWNWNVEQESAASGSNAVDGTANRAEEVFPKMGELAKKHKSESGAAENYESISLNQMPPMPTGNRIKMEHLTPQWSIESQMSQESSDDILQTSESDKSHMFSRSSTISHSPVSGQQTPLESQNPHYLDNHVKADEGEAYNQENKEILSKIKEEAPRNDPSPPKNLTPPPPSGSTGMKNSFRRNVGMSHKAINKSRSGSSYVPPPFVPAFNQSVNLETVPDNSEHPDINPVPLSTSPAKVTQQFPENNEVAPINDRNQYLETGQLSDENTNRAHEDSADSLPPPGLSRMVLGQMEQTENSGQENHEPPPGLSRMVLGQTESSAVGNSTSSPPAGLHRMVPGESSSPEASSRYPAINLEDDYTSETELAQITSQSRSATIGADTPPPEADRSETIGSNGDNVQRDTNLDGANLADDRRDSIEGRPQTSEIDNLVASVRDLAVGENTTDVNTSKSNSELRRQDTTDSEGDRDRGKSPRDGRQARRYKDDRREKDRPRERYSPDYGRRGDRRKYRERYYDDDTDYFSDKERDRRREDRVRREEYEKKYNSLRKDKDKDKRRRDVHDGREYRDPRRDYYYGRYENDYDNVQRSRPSSRSDSIHDSYRERGHDREHRRQRDRGGEHRRHRDVFNPYMQGYGYDPYNPYYQQYQYQYLENLRRTNPQAYAEWYRKYYHQMGQQGGAGGAPFGSEDKTSVHSGRSSANDELAKERYLRQSYYGQADMSHVSGFYREQQSVSSQYGMDDSSISRQYDFAETTLSYEDNNTASQRLTPAKFSLPHAKASISCGRMLKVLPHYPMDGQSALVEISQMQESLGGDDELRELTEFPGPLVKGVTHKKTIIEYCESKIRENVCDEIADHDSYVLMWELLILLLRQNGMVVGTDIAELLMKDRRNDSGLRPSSVTSDVSDAVEVAESNGAPAAVESTSINSSKSVLKEEYVTNKFREFLLYGSGKEALEWAMKHSLWGHALFLASKLDKRTYANVMMRFANGLPMNDPLQTLYQLLSGRLPASVTSVSDEKWGDWRPHLAMILSNTTQRPELDRKAITTLADTLLMRGSLYAAQFCYLMAEVGFSRYGSPGAKLVLLGANHTRPFKQFCTNEAIHMTEVYEYACSLNDSAFIIPEFQAYKYLIATRLADRGFLETSLSYLEQVSGVILSNASIMQPSLINKVCELAERLKYHDPIADADENDVDVDLDSSRPDNSWLRDLKIVQQQYSMGLITHESISNLNVPTPDMDSLQSQTQSFEQTVQDPWQTQSQIVDQSYQQTSQPTWQPELPSEGVSNADLSNQDSQDVYHTQFQQQDQQWNHQWSDNTIDSPYTPQSQTSPLSLQQPQQHDYWSNSRAEDAPRPQITMPNQKGASGYGDEGAAASDDFNRKKESAAAAASQAKAKQAAAKADKSASSTGWFGGIWSRLALRPKNQMKLPDDKNPSIVWDQEKKRWVNLEEDNNDTSAEVKPPPKMSEMMMPKSNPPPMVAPGMTATMADQGPVGAATAFNNNFVTTGAGVTAQSLPQVPNSYGLGQQINAAGPGGDESAKAMQPNMFKLQRNRNLKKSYVDVFNPGGKSSSGSNIAAPMMPNESFSATTSMNFFVPAPVADANAPVDFLTPSSSSLTDPNGQPIQS